MDSNFDLANENTLTIEHLTLLIATLIILYRQNLIISSFNTKKLTITQKIDFIWHQNIDEISTDPDQIFIIIYQL